MRCRMGRMDYRCVGCGGNNLCSGSISTENGLKFRPDSTSFLRLSFGVKVKALACVNCGITVLSMEPDDLKDFLEKPQQKLQFSLSTLLIATTLVAVVLGLAAYALRK